MPFDISIHTKAAAATDCRDLRTALPAKPSQDLIGLGLLLSAACDRK
jgi:hypothetical protein